MANFTLTAGLDTFTGTAGESNTFFFNPNDLQPTDTITGGATGGFIDVLSVTIGGTVTSGQFAGVTAVEELDLSSFGNTVTLTNGVVAGSSIGYFSIVETGGGGNRLDGSGTTNKNPAAFFSSP